MDRETLKETIRQRISCKDYLTKSRTSLYVCPFCKAGTHEKGTGSIKYYSDTNTWYCHACGKGGDVIDLYREKTGADYNTALAMLGQEIGLTMDAYKPIKPAETPASTEAVDYTDYYQECGERLHDPAAIAYLQSRGISVETAEACGIGFDPAADPANAPGSAASVKKPHPCPRIILPGNKSQYVGRSIDPTTEEKYRKLNSKGSKKVLFNVSALYAHDVCEVFVTEGAFDALSVVEVGAQAIALNSANNTDLLIGQLKQQRTDATLILCLDEDNAGRNATKKIIDGLQPLNIGCVTAQICGGYKDPNEHLTGNREAFLDAVEQARQEAAAYRDQRMKEELERQQRTGSGMIDSFLAAVKTRKYEPVPTGIRDIDKALGGGFMRQWIVFLGAPPGAGKTALAQWIFEGMAKRGTSCLYINLEMSRDQMLARSISRIAAQNGEKIKPVEVLQGYNWDWTQECIVNAAAEEYKKDIARCMIYNPETVTSDLDSIMQYAEEEAHRAESAGLPAPLLVLDYLQVITGGLREDKVDLIRRAIGTLKGFAIRHNTVVFVITAQNRNANKSGVSSMEAGRDTSNIEYGADLLLGLDFTKCLNRDGVKGKDVDDLKEDEKAYKTLRINKGRFSEPGAQVDLFFNGEIMTFSPIDKKHTDQSQPMRAGREASKTRKRY